MDITQIVVTALFGLAGSFLGLVFTRVYDYMWKPFFVDYYMERLQEDMDHLIARHADVTIQVSKAESEFKTSFSEVKLWLDKIESIQPAVNDIKNQISMWRSNYGAVCRYLNFWKRCNLGYKVVTKRREVTKYHDNGAVFMAKDIATQLHPLTAQALPSTHKLTVECRNEQEAWNLFMESANFKRGDKTIIRLARKLFDECYRLPQALIPLALDPLGKVMSSKMTLKEWQHAVNVLSSTEIRHMQNDVFPILEFCYQNLQDNTMRECFLTCSTWPKDYHILEDDLIICWMGLGLIDDYNETNAAYDLGYSIIESLSCACLLEHVRLEYNRCACYVKMHPVLRDLAVWIASDPGKHNNKWMVQAGVELQSWEEEKWVGSHQISLMYNHIDSLPEQLSDCSNLSVLILRKNTLRNLPHGLFTCLNALTYLDVSHSFIKELPATVGSMVNLKFLNLEFTEIKTLPKELGNLKELKYLLLRGTYKMESMAWELVSDLSALRFFDIIYCGGAKEIESEGGLLEQLHGRVMELRINIGTISALNKISSFSTVSILELEINNLEGTESLKLFSPDLFGRSTLDNLNQLSFKDCRSLKKLIVSSQDLGGIPRLEKLRLAHLRELGEIAWSGVTLSKLLPNLRFLEIYGCSKLRNVSWVLQLPNLEVLEIAGCHQLETVIADVRDSSGVGEERVPILAFLRLRELELSGLPNLRNVCSAIIPFPSLEDITVFACPRLRGLPFQVSTIPNKLQRISVSADLWAIWEDGRTKPLLQEYVR